jgi:hypothetical protein
MAMRLGEILVKAEAITEEQLKAALANQKRRGGLLGEILIEMDFLSEETLVMALSRKLGVPRADPRLLENPEDDALQRLSLKHAKQFRAVPLALQDDGRVMVIAIAEPQNLLQVDEVEKVTGCKLSPRLVGPMTLLDLFDRAYGAPAVQEPSPRAARGQSPSPAPARQAPAPPPVDEDDVRGLLQRLEESQRKEVAAMRAMVELLIDRGVFSREEYLARIRR